jgi:uncharacterized DUF497 family protein
MTGSFEWDPEKARENAIRHGVGFNDAMDVFFDPNAVYFEDEIHSTASEERSIVLGLSREGVLLVVFTERGKVTRIISARRANKEDQNIYEENRD